MTHFSDSVPVPSSHITEPDQLHLAAAAYLARCTGTSRDLTESDLRCHLTWCASRGLSPVAAQRVRLELYIRWTQEIRRFKPFTVSRRFSVAAGFYRTCVIDGLLEHSPAEHVRRPAAPPESPAPGFTHLQFEALLTAAREIACRWSSATKSSQDAAPGLGGQAARDGRSRCRRARRSARRPGQIVRAFGRQGRRS